LDHHGFHSVGDVLASHKKHFQIRVTLPRLLRKIEAPVMIVTKANVYEKKVDLIRASNAASASTEVAADKVEWPCSRR
jgi:DNA repair photolyase